MTSSGSVFLRNRLFPGLMLAVFLVTASLYWAFFRSPIPGPGSDVYERYADAFQVGVAALDADVADIADEQLTVAVNLVPDEPAGWANRGLLYLRTERLPEAVEDLERARSLAPDAAAIQKLLGMLARRQGRFSDAATHFRAAADRDSHDIRNLYLLSEVLEQENQDGVNTERLRLLNQMLEIQPANLKVLMDRLRLALQNSDPAAVSDTMDRLRQQSAGWGEKTRQELDKLETALSVAMGPESLLPVLQFSNLLLTEPAFRRSIAEVAPSDSLPGESLSGFLRLSPIQPSPAAADTELTFTSEPVPQVPPGRWDVVKSIWMAGDQLPAIFVANLQELQRLDEASALPALPVSHEGLISFDIKQ